MKIRILTGCLCGAILTAHAQTKVLSIDECRALAIQNNKELRMSGEKEQAAYHRRKAAFTNYLPKISVAGAYMRTSDELSLLSDEQKGTLGHISSGLVDALRTDTRNLSVASVMLTQPLYMGGKIVAYNKITRFAERMAQSQHDLQLQEVILEVDRTYWQIVDLQAKKRLAESSVDLLKKLDSDVRCLIDEGLATGADGLSVKVKLNEAEVALIQVDNGLMLSRMLLCQLCGLEMKTEILLPDETVETLPEGPWLTDADVATALENRPELRSLDMARQIGKHKVTIARSEFMPNVALTGGYLTSNPSLMNGFRNRFDGLWNVGVVVKIPVLTWGERYHKVQAARREAAATAFQFEETVEKIELQVTQNSRKLREAGERYTVATRSQAEAEENLRCARLGMQEGVIPVSNVLEAQTAWLAASSQRLTARIDVMLADLYLRKALGTLK